MLNDYRLIAGVWIKKDSYYFLSQIDTIIFDIDGVLVNVALSYYQTIKDAVQYYFTHIIKIPPKVELVERETILSFKMAGGFNDDWELCAALILFYLWKIKEYQIPTTSDLRDRPPVLSDFIAQHLNDGGGLSKMVSWIREQASNAEQIFSLWDKEMIFRLAKEFYAGQRHCYNFYHFQPSLISLVEGNMAGESILINQQSEQVLKNYKVGIYTGRNQAETNYILQKMGWQMWLTPDCIITAEDKIRKPSPLGLEILSNHFQSRKGLFIGDTMDDYLTVYNINRKYQESRYLSAIVTGEDSLTNKERDRAYQQKGVDLLSENVNQIILLLNHITNTNII